MNLSPKIKLALVLAGGTALCNVLVSNPGKAISNEGDLVSLVTPDGYVVDNIHPEFAQTYLSVMFQEHGWQCQDDHTYLINGVAYHILGAMQIMWDGSTRPVASRLGISYDDVANTCWANIMLAHELWSQTHTWRRWEAKPTYRTSGADDGSGF